MSGNILPSRTSPWQGKRAYGLVLGLFFLGLAWTWANRLPEVSVADAARLVTPHTGFLAPALVLTSVTGETADLKTLRGQVVVINFWATWCPPCRAEMPTLDAVFRARKQEGLMVLAVNQQEGITEVKAFGDRLGLSFPLLLDSNGQTSVSYQVRALPTTFFLDRRGVIRDMAIGGSMSFEQLDGKLGPLLRESAD